MKHIKRFFFKAFLLTVFLLYSEAINAYDFEVDGLCYNILSNYTVELTWRGINNPYIGDIVVPDNVDYNGIVYKVVRIGDYSFVHVQSINESGDVVATFINNKLTSVKLSPTLMSIGNHAFFACYGFTSIIIPNSVTSIGNAAFSSCI